MEDFDGGNGGMALDSTENLMTRMWERYVDGRRQRANVVHEAGFTYGHLTK
jgi:hypothetical protein